MNSHQKIILFSDSETIFTKISIKKTEIYSIIHTLPHKGKIWLFLLPALLFLAGNQVLFAQENGDDEQVRIEAEKLFAQKKFTEAFPKYSQLLSLHRKDPFYSYRFGVCMLYSDRRDPEQPIKYMELAVGQLQGEDALMLKFYLGVAYHQAYRFGEAIRALEAFKREITSKNTYYQEAVVRIAMCNNGVLLLQNLSTLVVMKRYEVNLDNFFRSYDISKFGGSIGPKPEFLMTKYDKKQGDQELIFFSDTHQVVYYSSYGKKDITGKDIYRVYKLDGGKWSEPERLSNAVNTEFDEDYPYLLPDGKTMYFCSKGHNSMGGYDIFRTTFDSTKGDWTTPVNVDFAINTPFDDIMFITDPSQRYAWFSSYRNSSDGRIMVYLVRIDQKIPDYGDYRPEMIGASDIDVNNEEYLNTVALLRQKASLEVNSNEEMVIDTPKITASASDNARYNIPVNATDQDIVDLAFFHVNAAEDQMNNFRKMRDASLSVSDRKKDQAVELNKNSQQLYDQALSETDQKKRKDLMAEATANSKKSEQLLDESNLAKQMYQQYSDAADNQSKTLEKLQNRAGYVQQLAMSRQLDTSVVLLKKLIDDVDTFKITLVELDKKIKGDDEYIVGLEKDISDNYVNSKKLEEEATKLDQEADAYFHEASLATDPEMKDDYTTEANRLKDEAKFKRDEAQRLKTDAKSGENELVSLKSNTSKRNDIVNNLMAMTSDTNNVANNNGNNDIANNGNNNANNNNGNNNSNNNSNQNDSNNVSNNNGNNDIANNGNNDVNNNGNNNSNNDSNRIDTNNVSNYNGNNDSRVEFVQQQVKSSLIASRDSVNNLLTQNDRQKDAVQLSFAQKKKQYDQLLQEWNSLSKKQSPSNLEQMRMTDIEANLKDLNLQMNVLSDYYSELDRYNSNLTRAENELEELVQNASSNSVASDTNALYAARNKSSDVIAALNRPSDNNNNSLELKANDFRSEIKSIEDNRTKTSAELNNLQKQLDKQQTQFDKLKDGKKKDQLAIDMENTRKQIAVKQAVVDGQNEKIVSLNDSLRYIEQRGQLLSETRDSYNKLSVTQLTQLSDEYKKLSGKPDVTNVSKLPDFTVSSAGVTTNHVDNPVDTIAGDNAFEILYASNGSMQDIDKNAMNDDVQDLVQAEYYNMGTEVFLVRIAVLKKKLTENPADSNAVKSEIEMLTRTMRAYDSEANAYKNNAENNFRLNGKPAPTDISVPQPDIMASYHMQQYASDLLRADSLRRIAENTTDVIAKNKILQQASEYDESARRHYLMGSDIYGVWSNSRYESGNSLLADNNVAADADSDLARMQMIEARQLRSEAFRTSDFEKQADLLNQARKLEQSALQLQQKSMDNAGLGNPEKMLTKTVTEIEQKTGTSLELLADNYLKNSDALNSYTGVPSNSSAGNDIANNNNNNNPDNNNNNHNPDNNNNNPNNNNPENNANNNNSTNSNNSSNNNNTTNNNHASNNDTNNAANANSNVEGLYYRVQIAASRQMVDTLKIFKNLHVVFEQSGGWYQFMTGYFTSYNPANIERLRIRPQGYADAFVVAYYNGKRIPVYEARKLEQGGAMVANNNNNVNPNTNNTNNNSVVAGNYAMTDVDGLVYSVQVGVYAKTRNSDQLFGIRPLIEEKMTNGYYRYFAGTFNAMNDAVAARNTIRANGVPDAFVVILYKGRKITQAEADRLIADGNSFGGGLKATSGTETNNNSTNNTTTNNNVPSVKPVFKVQIGAYSKDVPVEVVNALISLAGEGVETTKADNNMTIYTAGKFDTYAEAEAMKIELVGKGLADAFVVAYSGDKRMNLEEAIKLAGGK
ncbi:MAG: hypothetical protein CVU11_14725 [Bacteroidetes bacterium HGW-Bacteroidetes-6]|nr:MAG: hypothetical protein CVU11_14725 [Bacteroidetes bacterium HGW-Bacteroidetes-6]